MTPLFTIAFVVITVFFERLLPFQKNPLLRVGFVSDLGWYMFLQPMIFDLLIVKHIQQFGNSHRLKFIGPYPFWVQFVVYMLVYEFLSYCIHWFMHRSNLLWRFHQLHHSSTIVDWLSVGRNHFVDMFLGGLLNAIVFSITGCSFAVAATFATVSGLHGIWKHSNIKLKMGFLQYVIISPEMHRLHHLKDAKYQFSAYGNMLSIYDWIFGTAIYPNEQEYKNLPFGSEDGFPQNFLKQQLYVFRKRE